MRESLASTTSIEALRLQSQVKMTLELLGQPGQPSSKSLALSRERARRHVLGTVGRVFAGALLRALELGRCRRAGACPGADRWGRGTVSAIADAGRQGINRTLQAVALAHRLYPECRGQKASRDEDCHGSPRI